MVENLLRLWFYIYISFITDNGTFVCNGNGF